MKRTGKQGMKQAVLGVLLALPLAVQAQTYSKTETVEYHDDTTLWVLGQVKRTTTNGVETSRTDYGWKALPWKTYAFGKLQQTLSYDSTSTVASGQLGTVKTVTDGNGNVTTLGNWKRGIPQTIAYADSTSQSAVVNNNGWIDAVTDANGYKTCYTYDTMGRLASITHPSEVTAGVCDASSWARTTQSFAPSAIGRYGLPAGYWIQIVDTGQGRRVKHFDALWRPVLEEQFDNTSAATIAATHSLAVKRYDAAGRLEFQSYPVSSLTSINDSALKGTWTFYDALDRVTSVSQDSELGLLTTTTEYLTGFITRVTSPKGVKTETRYQAFDQPTYDFPTVIGQASGLPETTGLDITRDVYGKPLSIRKRDRLATVAVTRTYTYNNAQELCRTVEPETGATLLGYDGVGNLSWSAAGLPATTTCDATGATAAVVARKAARTYDARNRVKTLSFPNGEGNQAWTYTPDGQPASITTYNGAGNTLPVVNVYHYNRRRLLTAETSGQTDWYTWGLSYGYNALGHTISQNYADGTSVTYAPNALGQPTQVGTYATGVQYYPNGAIKQFTYGNGLTHAMTQNARQLPARSTDSGGALDLGYVYDKHANVGSITDYTSGARQSRAMIYDGLDRLTETTGTSFGTASYGYNVLDNVTTLKVTAGSHVRDHTYHYDAGNQLVSVTNTVGGATVVGLDYDVQGNLSNKNGQAYRFDFGNRLREVPSKETYRYDGHGRRVSSHASAIAQWQYGFGGQLMFSHDARNNRATNYIYLGNSLLALREVPMSGGGAAMVKYQHNDALGTAVAESDATGAVVRKSEYEPYGQLVNRPLTDGPGFTGHVQDAATGLTYMQQRYYDPMLGRFLSVDPVTASSITGANFNRYWYASNNPYKNTDPDGRCDGISTCRIEWEEKAVMRGEMTQQQKQENDKARGIGALIALPIAAAIIVAPEVAAGTSVGAALKGLLGFGEKKAAQEALKTTAHGAERIAGQAATRGGVLSAQEARTVMQTGRTMTQADGATVRILTNDAGRSSVVVSGERGVITTFKNLSEKTLERLSKRYGWE